MTIPLTIQNGLYNFRIQFTGAIKLNAQVITE